MTDELRNRFEYHAPDAFKVKQHEGVREGIYKVAEWLNDGLPDGREKALALTKLEEVMFWANASIARN